MATSISVDSSLVFILQVRIYIDPARCEEFYKHLPTSHDAVLAEPECLFFFTGEDTEEPGCIVLTEGWSKDIEWFNNVQLKKEYYKPYLAATEPMWVKPREFRYLTPRAPFNNFKLQ